MDKNVRQKLTTLRGQMIENRELLSRANEALKKPNVAAAVRHLARAQLLTWATLGSLVELVAEELEDA